MDTQAQVDDPSTKISSGFSVSSSRVKTIAEVLGMQPGDSLMGAMSRAVKAAFERGLKAGREEPVTVENRHFLPRDAVGCAQSSGIHDSGTLAELYSREHGYFSAYGQH